jgi:pyrimidine-nucleoside phosphorylase
MSFTDVIARKRDGHALTRAEIERFVSGVTTGAIPDYQASALLMAIVVRGLTDGETVWLTDAMVRSGERLDLTDLPGVKVGKHSTGGVGDKLSIAVAPLAAACGVTVPKLSGRGLGHTGGTLDKLESIPGFQVEIEPARFKAILRACGTAIVGTSPSLAPADRTLYALRDVTATVESVPLIAASVMSKKLAEGVNALLLDVKCGAGAFMKSEAAARELARVLVAIGSGAGVRTEAVITRMDAPLGRAVGNAVEVVEAIEVLKGRGPEDTVALTLDLAARMVTLSGRCDRRHAGDAVRRALASGTALDTLRKMIAQQGGDADTIDDYNRLPSARIRTAVAAGRSGFVSELNAELVGRASVQLGAGRQRVGDPIDHGAGVLIVRRPGEDVRAGDTVLELLTNDEHRLEPARALAQSAVRIGDEPPAARPLVLDTVS